MVGSAPPIQVDATAEDLSCATSATVSAWLYDDASGKVEGARVRVLDDADDNDQGDCAGNTLYVTPLNAAGGTLSGAGLTHMSNSPVDGFDIPNGYEYLVIFNADNGTGGWVTPPVGTNVQGSLLEGVRMAIDQGPHGEHLAGQPAPLWPIGTF